MALQNGELTSHVKSVVTDYTKALNKKESVEHFIGPLAYIIVNGVAKCLDIVGVLRSTINNASKVEIDIVEEENYETSFPAGTTICTICFKTEVAVNYINGGNQGADNTYIANRTVLVDTDEMKVIADIVKYVPE